LLEDFYRIKILEKSLSTSYRILPINKGNINIDFSTNDYLDLSRNQNILNASNESGKIYGVGSTGSRLLSGNYSLFDIFEKKIARSHNTEAALIFNSGFQCNLSVIACLTDKKAMKCNPLVFFDYLNHASLYQGLFLSGAQIIRYKHNDLNHLNKLISSYKNDNRPKFIVTETVFSMDGDIAPIEAIAQIALANNALLYLDEAHAIGMIGKDGYGVSSGIDLSNNFRIIMGTFSKAIGTSGAYIACSKIMKDYIINFCPGFIYSTANSPLTLGAAYSSWCLLPQLHIKRKNINDNSKYFRDRCKSIGLDIGQSSTNIVPIILETEERALSAQKILSDNGIKVSCIRPPTVPPRKSRIRIAIRSSHSISDIDKLLEILKLI